MAEKKKDSKKNAELNRRWRAWSHNGSMARLRSEGRLVALYVFLTAGWSTCLARVSLRKAARFMGVYPNTIRRGIEQMVEEGILVKIGKDEDAGIAVYMVSGGVTSGDPPGHHSCTARTRAVTGAHTSGDQRAHGSCTARTRAVTSAHTDGDHNAVCFRFSSIENTETNNTADAGAGLRPARRRRLSRLIERVPPPALGGEQKSDPAASPGIDSCPTLDGEVNT